MPRLETHYKEIVVPDLLDRFNYASIMEVPRITKITLNIGLGEALTDKNVVEAATADLAAISGQKPIVTKARKSVAAFKVREGWTIGCKVTLRRQRMYEFLDRLISVAIPRVRDFRGLSVKAFDGRGNFSLGFREQIVFPEIDYDKVDAFRGLNVTLTTSARTDEEAEALLRAFNFPLRVSNLKDN
ncbi:MAG: 50S ribosomal protein L5 [Acidiferrobacteraceae bacterium]|nr:50S ribosomal protein L5 [Acidiferrobacteraceae bacterium]|tara:strand:+ start:392 stop:949 length:558 start_codon:yes stop_codon:yes gene_type:complete